MRKLTVYTSIAAAAGLALATSAVAEAKGTPQRSSETPPGLMKALEKASPGLFEAIAATIGSNSRLQDLPVSA